MKKHPPRRRSPQRKKLRKPVRDWRPGRWDSVSIEEARAAAAYDLALERMTEEQYRAFDAIPSLDTASQDEFLRPFTARVPDADIEAKLRAWGFPPA
jgi:hypothetical protein